MPDPANDGTGERKRVRVRSERKKLHNETEARREVKRDKKQCTKDGRRVWLVADKRHSINAAELLAARPSTEDECPLAHPERKPPERRLRRGRWLARRLPSAGQSHILKNLAGGEGCRDMVPILSLLFRQSAGDAYKIIKTNKFVNRFSRTNPRGKIN